MPTIKITDVAPYDGEYQLDFADLTLRDWSTIKRISGVRQAEFDDAVVNVDPDLVVAFTVICLERSGLHRIVDEDKLYASASGKITIDYTIEDEASGDADPPPPAPSSDEPNRSGTTGSSGVSTTPAESSESRPQPTGSLV